MSRERKSTSQWMWSLVTNRDAPIPVRESVLIRLAQEQAMGVLGVCDTLLTSDCAEEWFMGIRGLVALGSNEALQRLFLLCAQCGPQKRNFVLRSIARILTSEHVATFTRLLRLFSKNNEIDTAGWTAAALALKDIQKRDNNSPDSFEDECPPNLWLI